MKKLFLTALVFGGLFASDIPANVDKVLKNNGCMSCHNVFGPNKAPAFAGVARKNIRWYGDNAKNTIINSIKKGSSGKYRRYNAAMPPYSNLSQKELEDVADWILSLKFNQRGKGWRMKN